MEWLKKLARLILQKELEDVDQYRANLESIKSEKKLLLEDNEKLQKTLNFKTQSYIDLCLEFGYMKDLLFNNQFTKPKGWINCEPNYKTIDGLNVPPNTLITINDKDLKKLLINKGFHKLKFEDLIYKLEKWIFTYIPYKRDPDTGFDDWRSASYTLKNRKGDCDNKAIFFQTCMHILGYGDVSVCKVGELDFVKGKEGHMWNEVLVNDKWIVIDPTNPKEYRTDKWRYYSTPGLDWFFNYYGVYMDE